MSISGAPLGCNQYGHAPGCTHVTGEDAAVDLMTPQTPVHPVESLASGHFTHVALGPGRAWGTLCDNDACDEPIYADDIGALSSARALHAFREHNVNGLVPAAVDEWVVSEKDGVRVSFTDLNEGLNGDYDPEDPHDEVLLRIDVQVRPEHPSAAEHDEAEPGWHWAEGTSSLCTNVRRDHVTGEQMRRLLNSARYQLAPTSRGGSTVSSQVKSFESMSAVDAP